MQRDGAVVLTLRQRAERYSDQEPVMWRYELVLNGSKLSPPPPMLFMSPQITPERRSADVAMKSRSSIMWTKNSLNPSRSSIFSWITDSSKLSIEDSIFPFIHIWNRILKIMNNKLGNGTARDAGKMVASLLQVCLCFGSDLNLLIINGRPILIQHNVWDELRKHGGNMVSDIDKIRIPEVHTVGKHVFECFYEAVETKQASYFIQRLNNDEYMKLCDHNKDYRKHKQFAIGSKYLSQPRVGQDVFLGLFDDLGKIKRQREAISCEFYGWLKENLPWELSILQPSCMEAGKLSWNPHRECTFAL
ncbi:hypothetical protein IEQ34_026855 [Dendrobium chrysotoxum]|uniref:Uncharacterized protein n=1 Tax=Dendrobium chrysotoxum TaxID=161865 RepID=A0AAV7FIE5_DENCH|nr:hypothetical protein IEQ34_026855 [Dendrobium chrysotoxum]